jgi:enamine deaminase RidA (YjgF/YER057c/UK114 family)
MQASPEDRLARLGLSLPPPTSPAANYVPTRRVGSLIFIAGQVPFVEGRLSLTGKLGAGIDIAQGQEQARIATLNALSAGAAAHGGLAGLRVANLMVFVASTPDFVEQHVVANGASDLLVDIFGDDGQHPRTAIATPCLPLDASVEVQLTLAVTSAGQGA